MSLAGQIFRHIEPEHLADSRCLCVAAEGRRRRTGRSVFPARAYNLAHIVRLHKGSSYFGAVFNLILTTS